MDLFASASLKAVEKGLQGSQLRQKTISENIANVDTPNYKAKTVSFKHSLMEASRSASLQANRTNALHIEFTTANRDPKIHIVNNSSYNHNGNNVDIDYEMSELAKNQIYYNALIERLNGSFNSLQTVIRGGR